MRWLPSLSFSHPHGPKYSSASSSFSTSDVDHPKKKSADATRGSGGVWPFGSGKKTSRPKKLQTIADSDGNGKSPPRWHDSHDDVLVPLAHSPTPFDRQFSRSNTTSSFSSSVAPQPLPLPDSALSRQRDADCPLPSPKDVPGPSSAAKGVVERDRADGVMVGVSSVFRIRR